MNSNEDFFDDDAGLSDVDEADREEYEKSAELLKELHELYPETVGQDLI